MRLHEPLGLTTFAIVVHKKQLEQQYPGRNPREVAWERLLNRIERFTTKGAAPLLLQHDDGANLDIRKWARKARRAAVAGSMFGTGLLKRPATHLIDDPIPRDSAQSYFVQLADLAAYAAFRRPYPPPVHIGTPLVPTDTWDLLGSSVLSAVNRYSGGPPGIVSAP